MSEGGFIPQAETDEALAARYRRDHAECFVDGEWRHTAACDARLQRMFDDVKAASK